MVRYRIHTSASSSKRQHTPGSIHASPGEGTVSVGWDDGISSHTSDPCWSSHTSDPCWLIRCSCVSPVSCTRRERLSPSSLCSLVSQHRISNWGVMRSDGWHHMLHTRAHARLHHPKSATELTAKSSNELQLAFQLKKKRLPFTIGDMLFTAYLQLMSSRWTRFETLTFNV